MYYDDIFNGKLHYEAVDALIFYANLRRLKKMRHELKSQFKMRDDIKKKIMQDAIDRIGKEPQPEFIIILHCPECNKKSAVNCYHSYFIGKIKCKNCGYKILIEVSKSDLEDNDGE